MHIEHEQWKGELNFWKEELFFLNERLDELVKRWKKKKVLEKLANYKNKFTILKSDIDNMLIEIEKHENEIAPQSKINTSVLDEKLMKNHGDFRDSLEKQRHDYSDLKKSFFRFLSKHM
ncbi:hypothetical protein PHEL85_1330 [Polaribacter sp. Hel1_85]|nr:hypothetical protein PHEL85_1330 [Polaribacter sp. Hel1_85]